MALIVELAPKLKIEFVDGEQNRKVSLRSKSVTEILNKYLEDSYIYLAAGGNIGNEIVEILKRNGSRVKHIKIKDSSKIEAYIRSGNNAASASEKDHKLTFDDINSIKREFASSLVNIESVLIPVYDIELEFSLEFLRKTNEYHKKSIVFGDNAFKTLNEKPTVAIFTKDQIIDYAPFKIVSDYELIKFSYSLSEGNKTKVLIMTDNNLLFYNDNICLEFNCRYYDKNMIIFAYLFAMDNKLDEDEWPKFVAAASQLSPGTKIGEIFSKSKAINMSVLHRW